jgi:toxin ParE1/3/4
MEKYKLLIFPSAKRELLDIVDYINELSPAAALKVYDEIVEKIGSLSQMHMRCPQVKTPLLKAKGYRVLAVRSYLVFFIVSGKSVEIRRILYGRRQYEFFL